MSLTSRHLEDSMACTWPCPTAQVLGLSLALVIRSLVLALRLKSLAFDSDLGGQCHECSRPANTRLLDTRALLEVVNDHYWDWHDRTKALNGARHDAVCRIFEMLMWINMAFDLRMTKTLLLGLWNGILRCATGIAKCNTKIFSRTSEIHIFRQRKLSVPFCNSSLHCLQYDLIITTDV